MPRNTNSVREWAKKKHDKQKSLSRRGTLPCRQTEQIPDPTSRFKSDYGCGFPMSWRTIYHLNRHT